MNMLSSNAPAVQRLRLVHWATVIGGMTLAFAAGLLTANSFLHHGASTHGCERRREFNRPQSRHRQLSKSCPHRLLRPTRNSFSAPATPAVDIGPTAQSRECPRMSGQLGISRSELRDRNVGG